MRARLSGKPNSPTYFTLVMIYKSLETLVIFFKVTVMHSMQAGFMEKANKYTEKALMQISKLKSKM